MTGRCIVNFILMSCLILLLSGCDKRLAVDTFRINEKVSDNTSLMIREDVFWEVSKPFSYSIVVGGDILVSETYFYYGDPDKKPRFEIIYAEHIIGVVEKAHPKCLLIMHDFSSGESWPHVGPNVAYDEAYEIRDRLLNDFNRLNTDGDFDVER